MPEMCMPTVHVEVHETYVCPCARPLHVCELRLGICAFSMQPLLPFSPQCTVSGMEMHIDPRHSLPSSTS